MMGESTFLREDYHLIKNILVRHYIGRDARDSTEHTAVYIAYTIYGPDIPGIYNTRSLIRLTVMYILGWVICPIRIY